jgi:hypothetical protein
MLKVDSRFLFLMPKYVPTDLTRLGKNDDGGYVLRNADIDRAVFLISGGINRDWTFELDLLQKNDKIKTYLFDPFTPLVSFSKFFPNIIRSFADQHPFNLIQYIKKFLKIPLDFIKLLQYHSWLKKNHSKHYDFKIGNVDSTEEMKLMTIVSSIKEKKKCSGILKLDIEGDEYNALKSFLNETDGSSYFSSCVIEFHRIISRRSELREIVDLFESQNFMLTHVHMNNFAFFNEEYNIYDCIELTFSYLTEHEKNQFIKLQEYDTPTELDFPCDKRQEDRKLKFVK